MLIGLRTIQPQLLPHLLRTLSEYVDQTSASGEGAWGMGFFQNGDVLLKKQPLLAKSGFTELVDVDKMCSNVVLVHHKSLNGAPYQFNDAHPFRYRNWLFAHEGFVPAFGDAREKLASYVPSFIAQNIKGRTDSELLFHLYLAFLHDAGQLSRRFVDLPAAVRALKSLNALVDSVRREGVTESPVLNMMITNGQFLLTARRGFSIAYRTFDTLTRCVACSDPSHSQDRDPHFVDHPDVGGWLIGSRLRGLTEEWRELDDLCWMCVAPDGEREVGTLSDANPN